MKLSNPFKDLTKFELCLWLCSSCLILIFNLFSGVDSLLSGCVSIIGVTSLIFIAKGRVFGHVLGLVFAISYGIISLWFKYYGEMITYMGMSAPIALFSIFSWLKNPYNDTKEVKVSTLSKMQLFITVSGSVIVTVAFYFILKAFDTACLIISTISVTTSFIASFLSLCRSRFYAIAYALNDIVLIILWLIASSYDFSYFSLVLCFIVFLFNDIYAFYNWGKMRKRQSK